MKLQAVIPEMRSEMAADRTRETIDELDITIRELRSAIFSLRRRDDARSVTDGLSLVIEQYVDPLGFRPGLVVRGPVDSMTARQSNELAATLREALSNVARHAEASTVEVSIEATASTVRLTVGDDGRGLDPDRSYGNGLRNMAERAASLGGECSFKQRATGGCELVWMISR